MRYLIECPMGLIFSSFQKYKIWGEGREAIERDACYEKQTYI